MSDEPGLVCVHCLRSLESGGIRLWDGKSYCRQCLERALPGLADYVLSHDRLEETATYALGPVLRGYAVIYMVIGSLFAVPFAWVGFQHQGLPGLLSGVAFACGISGAAAVIQVPGFLWYLNMSLPTVVVRNGIVEFFRGKGRNAIRQRPLESIQWRVGRARYDSRFRGHPVNQKAILLEFPIGRLLGVRFRERVACGWTDETYRTWYAFLTLATGQREPTAS